MASDTPAGSIPADTSTGTSRFAANSPGMAPRGAASAKTMTTSAVTMERTCAAVAPTARRRANWAWRWRSAEANVEATTSTTTSMAVPANDAATVPRSGASWRKPVSMSTPLAERSAAATSTMRKLPRKLER
jgi:hypothetical protein